MKTPLAITSGIIISVVAFLIFSSVPYSTILEILTMIILYSTIMIVGVYFSGVGKVKGQLDTKLSKSKLSLFYGKAAKSEISKCYIAKPKKNERRISLFVKLFVGFWGFSTSIISGAVTVSTYLGTEKIPQPVMKPLFTIPPQFVAHIPAPDNPGAFIIWTLFLGIPFALLFIVPAFLLRSTNLHYKKDNGNTESIPKYNWDVLSGILGIIGFTSLFFKDVLTSSYVQNQILNYFIVDLVVVGTPIAIFCTFYAWYIEPKLKPKILSYLRNDLHIRDES